MIRYRFRRISGAAGTWLRYGVLAAAVLTAALAGIMKGDSPEPQDVRIVQEIPDGEVTEQAGLTAEAASEGPPETVPEAAAPDIYVYVCGQVRAPGVYCLPAGSRVFEAVEAAGGLTEEAAPESVDMAALLQDARTVYVPSAKEAGGIGTGDTAPGQDGRIDINRADISLLASLPGIGEKRAAAIIEYREKNGRFTDISQLKLVSGIGEAVYSGLKDLIRVGE